MTELLKGLTNDMRIDLGADQTTALVDLMFEELQKFSDVDEVCKKLQDRFGLSEEDALLAMDRVPGGIIRALSGNPENRPNPVKDPLAHIAFERVWSELPYRHWFSCRKKPGGKWLEWFEELRRQMNSNDQQSSAGDVATRVASEK